MMEAYVNWYQLYGEFTEKVCREALYCYSRDRIIARGKGVCREGRTQGVSKLTFNSNCRLSSHPARGGYYDNDTACETYVGFLFYRRIDKKSQYRR